MEQIEALKAEGASEQELKDRAVADLALRKIFEEHFEENSYRFRVDRRNILGCVDSIFSAGLTRDSRAGSRRGSLWNRALLGCDRGLSRATSYCLTH